VPPPVRPDDASADPESDEVAIAKDDAGVERFFDLSLDLMGISNAAGHFVQINPAFERALGYSLADFSVQPFIDFVHPEDVESTRDRFAKIGAGSDVVGFENRYRCKDGSYRWLLWSATGMRDGFTYAVARDITDRKQMDEELRMSLEQAVEASRQKWAFLANMSHELRTPLNGLIGLIQLLRDTALDATQVGYVDAQESSAEALVGVVGNVLHFSELEAGGLGLERSEFELRPVVVESCQLHTRQARAKGLRITFEVDAAVPFRVGGDRARLRQVLLNLVSNAVKFTAAGEVVVKVAGDGDSHLRFSVSDTGIGIEQGQAATLFGELAQPGQPSRRHDDGSGLGLAISRRLVELMDGQIGVRPREGGGSVFWFSADLPAVASVASGRPPRASDSSMEPIAINECLSVLLAEDNVINCIVAEALLTKLGMETMVAHNGREAVDLAGAHRYDAILMDCMMPELDGLQATRQIRAAEGSRRVPIIAMTALAMPGDREACLAAGMDDYVSKPVRLPALKAAIRRATSREPSHIEATVEP
jgi:PAS domain S-box-containing protein